jgi:hypothetical protein
MRLKTNGGKLRERTNEEAKNKNYTVKKEIEKRCTELKKKPDEDCSQLETDRSRVCTVAVTVGTLLGGVL